MKVSRQGDVGIIFNGAADKKDLVEKKDKILAHGEVTGHAHRISTKKAKLYVDRAISKAIDSAKEMTLVALGNTEITHEEHEGVVLPIGNHRVVIQREYDWALKMARKVVD